LLKILIIIFCFKKQKQTFLKHLTNNSFFETQNTFQKTKQNKTKQNTFQKIIHNKLFRELFTPSKNILKKQTDLFVGVEDYLLLSSSSSTATLNGEEARWPNGHSTGQRWPHGHPFSFEVATLPPLVVVVGGKHGHPQRRRGEVAQRPLNRSKVAAWPPILL
jgi:hypothetical protein